MATGLTSVPASHTRNLCIVAHVDFVVSAAQSSFADSLLASNGIISSRLAGTIRYLDSREDEQERGITMESSAVSLGWRIPSQPTDGEQMALLRSFGSDGSLMVCGGALPTTNRLGSAPVLEEYRINLIDTPGHVDFSSEVSTASRLCDGALVLVDAVEGVCTQTITVLRQTHLSYLRPLLVINKVDRLVTELKLSPSEAYHHLSRIIEDVNAIVGSFYAGERMEDDWRWRERREAAAAARSGAEAGADVVDEEYEERDDSNLYFDPSNGTVLFSSAMDGWAFRISRFAQLYAVKLGMSEANLNRCLWGDWYLDPKTKRVINRKKMEASGKKLKPLFVQFVLEAIWNVYDSVVLNNNPTKVDKIISSLNIKVRPQDLRAKDSRNLLLSIFSQFLPLAPSTFRTVIDKVPSPPIAQSTRMPKMLHPDLGRSIHEVAPTNRLEEHLYSGEEGVDKIKVAYVSKMFAVKSEDLPQNQRKQLTADEMRARGKAAKEARDRRKKALEEGVEVGEAEENNGEEEEEATLDKDREELIGFARLYSGTIEVGQGMYAVLPKYNAALGPNHASNAKHLQAVKIEQLYMMMGRELVAVEQVTAGNLFAVGGLEGVVGRNATLCAMPGDGEVKQGADREEDKECLVNLAGLTLTSAPIVRVALEPKEPSQMDKLVEGLRLLNQADPCVETLVQETGEHVILTAGELHLERCLKDLRDRFARIEITVSPPIVPFRETAISVPEMAPPKVADRPRGTFLGSNQSNFVTFAIRAVPLPEAITTFLVANMSTLKRLQRDRRAGKSVEEDAVVESRGETFEGVEPVKPEDFWTELEALFKKAGRDWVGLADQVWAFGPKRVGPNILVDRTSGHVRSLRKRLERQGSLISTDGTALATPAPGSPSLKPSAGEASLDTDELAAQLEDTTIADDQTISLPDVRELDENFDSAFQLATNRGPMCGEPVIGMAFFLEAIELNGAELTDSQIRSKWSLARGQIISTGREAFHAGLLDWSPRLQLAMYSCDIQATGEVLGKVYGVVSKRKGRIVSEEMKEGTAFFTIRALLPVVESFGFADEIRTRSSGAASPQLVFHGFEILDQDPFWVPTTEEELEDLGEKADRENIARRYMDAVRRRKVRF
ncbi:BZ3500_MvSof-1268-A1-R1_Chr5-2g08074 [Microbotryum saponariae]|uniref:Ribosome assembly protein 1 n=1 Tax=Microbotryum saponariae TaxID=289078 RepID=A0A2X0M215_9BASI|nr:BZ3500_MvSof-1268-A1-R1_Chr5-2g08074 [Microbotryum saponariae]SDA05943.1 BZ3501_MvSof-1269-A2-R1_Chr5-2g07896 [Microbotryum saponariae]